MTTRDLDNKAVTEVDVLLINPCQWTCMASEEVVMVILELIAI